MTKKRIRLDSMKALRRFNNYLINEVFNDKTEDVQKIKLLTELIKLQKSLLEGESETRISEIEQILGIGNEKFG